MITKVTTVGLLKPTSLYLIMTLSCNMYSQVTIGSAIEPNKGALLDLKSKEADMNNATATKGLLLPRVGLEKNNSLHPISVLNAEDNDTRKLHSGLVVYNTTNNPLGFVNGTSGITSPEYMLMPCTYVWTGELWENVGCTPEPPKIECTSGTNHSITLRPNATVNAGTTYLMSYSTDTPNAAIPAYSATKNGITVSYEAQTLSTSGSGSIQVSVSGTLAAGITESFNFDANTYFCPFTVEVESLITLSCPTSPVRTLFVGQNLSTYTYNIAYTCIVPGTVLPAYSKTVNGLTLSYDVVSLSSSGTIAVKLTGTPLSAETTYIVANFIGNRVCSIPVEVVNLPIVECTPENLINGLAPGTVIPSEGFTFNIPYSGAVPGSSMENTPNVVISNTITYTILKITSVPASGEGYITVKTTGTIPAEKASLLINLYITNSNGLNNGQIAGSSRLRCSNKYIQGGSH